MRRITEDPHQKSLSSIVIVVVWYYLLRREEMYLHYY